MAKDEAPLKVTEGGGAPQDDKGEGAPRITTGGDAPTSQQRVTMVTLAMLARRCLGKAGALPQSLH